MGHGQSIPRKTPAGPEINTVPKKQKPFDILLKTFKKFTKYGLDKRRRNKTLNVSKSKPALPWAKEEGAEEVIIPGTQSLDASSERKDSHHHYVVNNALSKLAVFAELSRDKIASRIKNGRKENESKFKFHDHASKVKITNKETKVPPKDVNANKTETSEAKPRTKESVKKIPRKKKSSAKDLIKTKESEKSIPADCRNNNDDVNCRKYTPEIKPSTSRKSETKCLDEKESFLMRTRKSKSIQDAVVRRILTGRAGERKEAKTPEELYHKNLKKFEALLAFTATTSDEDDTDSVDENYNRAGSVVTKRPPSKPQRIIATSKNRVEVDVYFLDWLKSLVSHKTEEEPEIQEQRVKERKGGRGEPRKMRPPSRNPSKSRTRIPIPPRYPELKGKIDCYRDKEDKFKVSCIKKGPCAGKGALAAAPPAYLDYGCAQSFPGAASRKGKDPIMDRLKNVDVVEQLTYMIPSGGCCGDGAGNEEDNCDYYAVCESCGEMEPVPEELANKLKGRKKKKQETTPVTYSRRQRFSFKNKEDENDDGPPFKYDPLQGKSCRCPCCVAGLRRNPDCGCKCCQTMGNARRMNSFDEIPVGKNPQIRKIPCPMEAYEKRMEECKKQLPAASGLYKFDICENKFERQVPRTPTPIIVEVPAPRGLDRDELVDIATGLTRRPKCEGQSIRACNEPDPCCCCCEPEPDPCCEPEYDVQPQPIYLPPVYGQTNPCCPPCCNQNMDNNNNDQTKKPSTGYSQSGSKRTGTGTSYPSGSGGKASGKRSESTASLPES